MNMPRFKEQFVSEVIPKLMKDFKYGSPMEVPRFQKITINMGLGEAVSDKKFVDSASQDLASISGHFLQVSQLKFLILLRSSTLL